MLESTFVWYHLETSNLTQGNPADYPGCACKIIESPAQRPVSRVLVLIGSDFENTGLMLLHRTKYTYSSLVLAREYSPLPVSFGKAFLAFNLLLLGSVS